MEYLEDYTAYICAVIAGAFVLVCGYIFKIIVFAQDERDSAKKGNANTNESFVHSSDRKKDSSSSSAASNKGKKRNTDGGRWGSRSDKQQVYAHPWLLTTLKGHTGQVLDMEFSTNGKYLASCAEDRSVMLWDTKDLTQKNHKSVKINIDYDYANFVRWSPDNTAFVINKFSGNLSEVYKLEKKKDGSLTSTGATSMFPKFHSEDVIGMGIACNGKYMMSCSNKTDLMVCNLKGEELARLDTYLMSTNCAKLSPCGKFIAASGFAPDVKIWEVVFSKLGEFQEVKRAFELSGHTSGVYDVAFDQDTSHIATISKDGTWKLFDTKVDYKKGQSPRLLTTGTYEQTAQPPKIALSPDSEVLAVATSNNLYFYSTFDGTLDYTLEEIYAGPITCVLFDSAGKYILTSGDKQIRVFHNVTGHRCNIDTAKEKLKSKQTSATKERLLKLIEDSEALLKSIDEN